MGITVNLNHDLIDIAKSYSVVESRSIPKQIEHWAMIGRIAEDNPDLSYENIKEILLGLDDVKNGRVKKYIE